MLIAYARPAFAGMPREARSMSIGVRYPNAAQNGRMLSSVSGTITKPLCRSNSALSGVQIQRVSATVLAGIAVQTGSSAAGASRHASVRTDRTRPRARARR